MSKTQKARVEALEKRSGGDVTIIVCWSTDGSMWINGELLSEDELKLKYPDIRYLEWEPDDVIVPLGIDLERI